MVKRKRKQPEWVVVWTTGMPHDLRKPNRLPTLQIGDMVNEQVVFLA